MGRGKIHLIECVILCDQDVHLGSLLPPLLPRLVWSAMGEVVLILLEKAMMKHRRR